MLYCTDVSGFSLDVVVLGEFGFLYWVYRFQPLPHPIAGRWPWSGYQVI